MFLLSVLCLIGTTLALPVSQTEDGLTVSGSLSVSWGEETDNLFDDILKAVQVATPIITTLASGKRDTEDSIISAQWGPLTISLGEDADNLFDDILKAVQVTTPIVTALAGKRDTEDALWLDFLPQPLVLGEEQENLFGDILKVVETIAPLAIAVLKRDLSEEQENLFGDILKVVETVAPLAIAVVGKREAEENLFGDILSAVQVATPIITALASGKRDTEDNLISATWGPITVSLGNEADNLFDDILKAVQVATPIVTALAGKRVCCFWDIDPILPVVTAPIISPLIAGRDVQENLWDDIVEALSQPMYSPSISLIMNTIGAGGEESDNLFDDILKAVQVATPIVTALAGKRDVADSEWFDTFLAAVEAATPTILGVIQGAGTA